MTKNQKAPTDAEAMAIRSVIAAQKKFSPEHPTIREIAEVAGYNDGYISRLLDRCEAKKLISRKRVGERRAYRGAIRILVGK